MLLSLNWLKRLVDLSESPVEIGAALTSLGFEVEALTVRGAGLSGVVVAEVRTCTKHPEADRLSVCQVFDGQEEVQVVCGASNVEAGQKVLLAKVGAELPGGLKIKKAKLRGQESSGMICAEDELGLGESHAGIMVLDSTLVPGLALSDIPGLCDVTFEINVTPNRPDALGHLGVAHELAAKFGRTLRVPSETLLENGNSIQGLVALTVEDPKACPRYVGRVIQGVKVGPSPEWLVHALATLGKKSISNVVDLTNYVLLEWGQPSHAFDLDCLSGKKIVVRKARAQETLKTLDGVIRNLSEHDMVIADGEKAQVLAGVMGGEHSGVTTGTKNIFLEVAYFNPRMVRNQSKRHGLSSDSSYRFERGVDPLVTTQVCDTLAALIARWCGGSVAQGRLEERSEVHPKSPRQITLRPSRVEKLLGISVAVEKMESLLGAIGIRCLSKQNDSLHFEIPGFRSDIEREVDLIEEVARLLDYNSIPAIMPRFPLAAVSLPPGEVLATKLRHTLRDLGLSETISLHFLSPKNLERLRLSHDDLRKQAVALKNPLSEEWSLLPTTTLPGLLLALERNQNTQEPNVRLFEVGRGFYKTVKKAERDSGVVEEALLGIAMTGEWNESSSENNAKPIDFARLKGLVENLCAAIRVELMWKFRSQVGFLHPVESAELFAKGSKEPLAVLGTLHPKVQVDFGLKNPVMVAEFRLQALLAAPIEAIQFAPFSTQSRMERDLNLVIMESYQHGDILKRIPKGIPALEKVKLEGIYRGPGVPENHKALLYRFSYRHAERSLTDEEVNASQEKIKVELLKDSALRIK